jgi:hypothetical protein
MSAQDGRDKKIKAWTLIYIPLVRYILTRQIASLPSLETLYTQMDKDTVFNHGKYFV